MSGTALGTLFSFGADSWLRAMLGGFAVTIACAILGYASGLVLGLCLALAKLGRSRLLVLAAQTYTTLLRGVPPLLVIFLLFFGTNDALMWIARGFGHTGYIEIDAFAIGTLAVALVSAAYSSEVLRAAYLAVPRGQFEACAALGLKPWAGLWTVILPQMLRIALPGLGNVWIMAVKETTLLSVISLAELMRVAGLAGRATGQPFVFYGIAAVLYFLLVALSTRLLRRVEFRFRWA